MYEPLAFLYSFFVRDNCIPYFCIYLLSIFIFCNILLYTKFIDCVLPSILISGVFIRAKHQSLCSSVPFCSIAHSIYFYTDRLPLLLESLTSYSANYVLSIPGFSPYCCRTRVWFVNYIDGVTSGGCVGAWLHSTAQTFAWGNSYQYALTCHLLRITQPQSVPKSVPNIPTVIPALRALVNRKTVAWPKYRSLASKAARLWVSRF